jgi:NTE family protein
MSFPKVCRIAGSLLLFPGLLIAQQQAPSHSGRKTVGVALSGGSALGLAHIGVIHYFEKNHIPIDDVAGTSMGGVVGGLYATGMNYDDLSKLAAHTDWDGILNPIPPFADQPIADKQKWVRTFGDFTLRFGRGFSLPSGLNPGEALSLLLSRTTIAYSNVSDFDQLPTPFRCVATDLVSGDAVVLDSGSLPVAMRATMSLPGIFTPVKIGQRVLVDGGVLENIPVDEVRKMGAKVVIAVAFASAQPKPGQFKSMTAVLKQTVEVAIDNNEKRSLANADLIIRVDTSAFSATDFNRWQELIDAGYKAAEQHADELSRYKLSDDEWAAYVAARNARMRPAERSGRVLAVTGPNASFEKNARGEIDRSLKNKVVAENDLENVLSGIVSATAVPGASYNWQAAKNGEGGYAVHFADRPTDQVLARFSGLYSFSSGEPQRFEVKISTAGVFKNGYKARMLTAIDAGYDPGIRFEPYKPFGGSLYFVAPQTFIGRTHFDSYSGKNRQEQTRDRVGGALYGGIGTWRTAQLRLGAEAGYDSYSQVMDTDGVSSRDGGYTSPMMRWNVNTQDSGGIPTHGIRTEGALGYTFRKTGTYPFLQQEFSGVYPIANRFSLFARDQTGTSFGRKLGYYDQFTTGERETMPAFRYQEFHANTLVVAGSGMILRGPAIPFVSTRPGVALWYEAGRFDLGSAGWATHQNSSFSLVFPSRLGATGAGVSFDENGRARFRLFVGSF